MSCESSFASPLASRLSPVSPEFFSPSPSPNALAEEWPSAMEAGRVEEEAYFREVLRRVELRLLYDSFSGRREVHYL